MSLIAQLAIDVSDARDAEKDGEITPEESENRIDQAHEKFNEEERAAWEAQLIEGYEKWGSAFLDLIDLDTNALWKSHWAGK